MIIRTIPSAFRPMGTFLQAGYTKAFTCSGLFTFKRASEATCAWANYTTVMVTLTSTATIVPSDNITLIANK
eukprot:24638-Eustigmatos_ZCMA.PRE.1